MIAEFLNSLTSVRALSPESGEFDINDPDHWDLFTGGATAESGERVSAATALTLAPVWQAVSIISGDVATATMNVFRRIGEGDREVDDKHPAEYLISQQPNDEMSAFELWRRFMLHAMLWQNAYLYVDRQGRLGRPVGLYNLLPDRTCSKRTEGGMLYYVTEVDGVQVPLQKEEVLHVKGLSFEPGNGCELYVKARNSWGLALAAEGFGSKFFANGAQAGGIIELPIGMNPEAQKNVESGVGKKYTGKSNWFKTMVLRDGAKFHATTIDAQKSQLTELREQQVRDTARFANLPPGKLGLEDSVSYNSAEQAQIQYITGCLTHWFGAIRGEAQLKLLTDSERRDRTHFIDFNISKLIERDLKTQVEILEIERRNEIINAAEWRRKRDLPPRDDPESLEYANPNTKPSGTSGSADSEEDDEGDDGEMENAMRRLLYDAVSRMGRRAGQAARKASKSTQSFVEMVDDRCASQHKGFEESLLPVSGAVGAFVGRDGASLCGELQMRFFAELLGRLSPLIDGPASELESQAQAACLQFESEIADLLCEAVFASQEKKDAA